MSERLSEAGKAFLEKTKAEHLANWILYGGEPVTEEQKRIVSQQAEFIATLKGKSLVASLREKAKQP